MASTAVTEHIHARLAEAGYGEFRVAYGYTFQLLAATGGATGVEVARHLGITKQSAGTLLDGLHAAGYINTMTHPGDSRSKLSELSSRGWECIRAAEAIWKSFEECSTRHFGEDLRVTRRVLEALVIQYGEPGSTRLKPPR